MFGGCFECSVVVQRFDCTAIWIYDRLDDTHSQMSSDKSDQKRTVRTKRDEVGEVG